MMSEKCFLKAVWKQYADQQECTTIKRGTNKAGISLRESQTGGFLLRGAYGIFDEFPTVRIVKQHLQSS